jgi:hypothetical protein
MGINFMKKTIFNLIWLIIKSIPGLKERVYTFYSWKIFELVPFLKKLIYLFYDKFWFIELSLSKSEIDFNKIKSNNYEIELSRIKYITISNIKKNPNWDRPPNLNKIEDTEVFDILVEHFTQDKDWDQIEGIKKVLSSTLRYLQQSNPINDAELPRFLERLDMVYSKSKLEAFTETSNPIKVGIGRNGGYFLLNSLFLITIFKILNIKKVPVQIEIRHPDWIKFCEDFLRFKSIHGEIYQPITHPDLTFKSTYSDKRFELMKNNVSFNKGRLLDIGANLGYFCHKFEELGFNCYAVEIRPSNVYFMKKLRDLEAKKFKIINSSIFELKGNLNFLVIVALNIFHHFLREKKLFYQLVEFLGKIKVREMFFQPHNPKEKVMQNAYRNYNNQEFVDFIIKHSCLNKFTMLAESPEGKGRPLYKLYQ